MSFDAPVMLGAFIVGIAVGLTGMGGGALMTPVLVLLFRVQPLAAVSSDLVASFVMKPLGGAIHLRRGTVHWDMVGWLCLGSVPCAFLGAVLLHALGRGQAIQNLIQVLLGLTLLVAAAALAVREAITRRRGHDEQSRLGRPAIRPRRLATVAVGALGGLIVGLTSVGSGTLIVVLLLWLYPGMRTRDIVGTDLVQAIPLVGSAALGHLLLGNVQLGLTSSLVIGSVPGVVLGAQISSQAGGRVIRPVLVLVLLASGLKLLGVGTVTLGVILLAVAVVALGGAAVARLRALGGAVSTRAS
jgi:uncharacterized protein